MSNLKVSTLKRIFIYNAMQLDDPDPDMKTEEVKEFWSDVYPELTQAVIEGPEYKDDCIQYTFRKAVGTKGQGKAVSKKEADDVADKLKIMTALARIVARTEPGARAVLPPSSSLEPV